MSSLANLRLISQTPTSVTLGVTTDSFAGDLYVGMRTSGPYASTGDETTIIADAVGTIINPAYGEQTFTVDGLSAGTQYYFGAVQQYGDERALFDHTFEASRPLPAGSYTCSVERDVLIDGEIKHFAVDEPVCGLLGMYFVERFGQHIADTEDFVTDWTSTGGVLSNSPVLPPMQGRTAKLWDDDGSMTEGEMSLSISVTPTEIITNQLRIGFAVFVYVPEQRDNDYLRIDTNDGTNIEHQVYNLRNGTIETGGTAIELYQYIVDLGTGWYRVCYIGLCQDNVPINIKVSRVDTPTGTTTMRDGSRPLTIFGANAFSIGGTRAIPLDYCSGVKTQPTARLYMDGVISPATASEFSFRCDYQYEWPAQTGGGNVASWQFTYVGNPASSGANSVWAQGHSGSRTYVNSNNGTNLITTDRIYDRTERGVQHIVRGRLDATGLLRTWVGPYASSDSGGTHAGPYAIGIQGFAFSGRQAALLGEHTGFLRRAVFWDIVLTDQELEDMVPSTLYVQGDYGKTTVSFPNGSISGKTIDASKAVFHIQNSTHDYPTAEQWCDWSGGTNVTTKGVTSTGYSSNYTWDGGVWLSEIPLLSRYAPTYCNKKNMSMDGVGGVVKNQYHMGGWDFIDTSEHDGDDFEIRDCYMTLGRDDYIESDSGRGGSVYDCLIDGSWNGHSVTNSWEGYIPGPFLHSGVLLRMRPFLGNEGGLSTQPFYLHLFPWKADFSGANKPTQIDMVNCVYAMQLNVTSAEINNTNFWNNLWGMQTAASTNNKILWLSNEPLITIFQNPDPAWTVLAGDAAVNEWYSVRDAWLAAHPGDWEQYRIDWFAQHGIPPNGETIELGFASGPTSGSFNLTDYGRDLDTWGLRRGCSLGIKLTPNSANMNTTILTLGHMTLSVAGDTWTFSAEGGRTVSVVQPYSAGVQVFLRMRTNPYGWISLKVDNNQVDTELADESAGFFTQPVTSGTFGFPVDLFRLCPFYLRNWEWSLWT